MTPRIVKQRIIFSLAMPPLCAVAVFLFSAMSLHAEKVRVTGNNVNLRSEPKSNAEILKQVSVGVELEGTFGLNDEWVRITPPQEINFWIFGALVEDSTVNVARAQIRSGAGLTYSVVGQVERGTKLVERDRLGDWIKIAPPEGTYVWISSKFVEVVEPPPPPPPPPQEEEKPEEPVEGSTEDSPQEIPADVHDDLVALPEEKPILVESEHPNRTAFGKRRTETVASSNTTSSGINKDRLSSGIAQGKPGRFTGRLEKAGATGTSPSRYRLMTREGGVLVVTAYVLGKEDQLESLLDKQMTIEGPVYWFRFNNDPAILAEQIHLRK